MKSTVQTRLHVVGLSYSSTETEIRGHLTLATEEECNYRRIPRQFSSYEKDIGYIKKYERS